MIPAAPSLPALPHPPAKALAVKMAFFQRKAEEILAEIDVALKRGVPAAELQRPLEEACKFKVRTNEAAVQLAPYVHSEMPTLVVQHDATTGQYVIRVSNALPDGRLFQIGAGCGELAPPACRLAKPAPGPSFAIVGFRPIGCHLLLRQSN
jgi:hypothetical protein